jgi:hypothetical protein
MSIPEQTGKVATSLIEGLKTNPSCLAALAIVALFAILQYFDNRQENDRIMLRTQEVTKLLDKCMTNNEKSSLRRTRMPANLLKED